MEDILYTEADVKALAENPAFCAFMQDVKDRVVFVLGELEVAPKDAIVTMGEKGIAVKVAGVEFHQGELASLRFVENCITILKDDLEGGVHNANRS